MLSCCCVCSMQTALHHWLLCVTCKLPSITGCCVCVACKLPSITGCCVCVCDMQTALTGCSVCVWHANCPPSLTAVCVWHANCPPSLTAVCVWHANCPPSLTAVCVWHANCPPSLAAVCVWHANCPPPLITAAGIGGSESILNIVLAVIKFMGKNAFCRDCCVPPESHWCMWCCLFQIIFNQESGEGASLSQHRECLAQHYKVTACCVFCVLCRWPWLHAVSSVFCVGGHDCMLCLLCSV